MQTKSQRNRRTQTNRTSEQDVLAKAVEELVREGVYTGETGFRGLIQDVTKSFLQAALQGELTAHLNDEREAAVADAEAEPEQAAGMRANKRVKTDIGEVEIDVPRDRNGTFEPILVPKHARTFGGLDSQLIAMYARGMSTRDISAFVKQQYGINASPEYISTVTDSVLADIESWQSRPLDEVYPVVFFDALRVNIRDGVTVKKMAVHIAIGINARGMRDVLGMWIAENEGASFWASVFSSLKSRGVQDILIAVTDGLTGMTKAIETVFPQTEHQTCIVHLIRASTAFISHKDRKAVCALLKPIYGATDAVEAEHALEALEQSELGRRYPAVAQAWRRAWEQVIPFFNFPPEVRRLIYTTNSIEGLNRAIRKVIKTRTLFPNEKTAKKLIFLAIQGFTEKWKRPAQRWAAAMPFFALRYGDRFTGAVL